MRIRVIGTAVVAMAVITSLIIEPVYGCYCSYVNDSSVLVATYDCGTFTWELIATGSNNASFDFGRDTADDVCRVAFEDCICMDHPAESFEGYKTSML